MRRKCLITLDVDMEMGGPQNPCDDFEKSFHIVKEVLSDFPNIKTFYPKIPIY